MKTNTPLILSAPKGGHLAYLAGDGVFGQPVYTVTWDPESQRMLFFADSGFHVAQRPDDTPVLIAADLNNRNRFHGWVML